MNLIYSLLITAFLLLAVLLSAPWPHFALTFGVVIPSLAAVVFIAGFVCRVLKWAMAPVPFRVPTTCGQQRSLAWIKNSPLENPHTAWGAAARMFLEIFFFRSLFRNTGSQLREGPRLTYSQSQWLWLGAIAFHGSLLVIVARHLRFFMEPVPPCLLGLQSLDAFFQIGAPALYLTDAVFLAALTYLFFRRVLIARVRYISLPADYFPLVLIFGIAVSGILMRYFFKVDVIAVKKMTMGLAGFNFAAAGGIGTIFFVHLFFVSALLAYFPFSKLMHMGGIFLSPTRNLANNSRRVRHVNPWNPQVKVHTYQEYEDEFHDVMKTAGLPLERQ
ncbi:MAG: sulfate reduction electron transfer complex DsrMKJOP subunit DsrM [Elusimicrobia bacterium]|nr:sulfate reduction electron transfer complex DsrMKJOP subunit DsrM [Elusimicrobiota bacterium]